MFTTINEIKEAFRICLRRLFRRTPPQRELGWFCLADRKPTVGDANNNRLVEFYSLADDSLCQAYEWSLGSYPLADAKKRFWRPLVGTQDIGGRSIKYFERSRSIFG